MAFCPQCSAQTMGGWKYCAQCGASLHTGGQAKRIHLDELQFYCENCGKEEVFGKLIKCHVCHDRSCDKCSKSCIQCGAPTDNKCLSECTYCHKLGCTDCFERCETCNTTVMCRDCAEFCDHCDYATCRDCLDYCKKCGGPICHYCVEEGHVEQQSDN